jgi:hypothetical protein
MSPKTILILSLLAAADARAGGASAKASQARVDAAAAAYAAAEANWKNGTVSLDTLCVWSERWYLAQRDQPLKGKALADAADADLKRMQDLEALVQQEFKAGAVGTADVATVTYFRSEAELYSALAHGK